mmetsp:Transcript_25207/g.46017  ORF Transcript_25207/g.46017 Transcript_25207/m.46017 type:complete len:92 (+) Transcript_25207:1466-1741(+)
MESASHILQLVHANSACPDSHGQNDRADHETRYIVEDGNNDDGVLAERTCTDQSQHLVQTPHDYQKHCEERNRRTVHGEERNHRAAREPTS